VLHQIAPTEPYAGTSTDWYGTFPAEHWRRRADEGLAAGRSWAPVLRRRLPDILDAIAWIEAAFTANEPHVSTHRDVEPWNVLMTGRGPVLIDWDTAGPDCAPLETAQASIMFALRGHAEPDATSVTRTLDAYLAHGGLAPQPGRDIMARRVGLRLSRTYGRLLASLRHSQYSLDERTALDDRAATQLDDLPQFIHDMTRWSALLGRR
jgi:Ser/Thr protein kinase RdoA (MazF antagonist)